ncbi:MAG: hypothetical protein FWF35_02035 [Elusimicrobia bacterium]|nr:hypothetical protein [Elusimicrobiota bacterium]
MEDKCLKKDNKKISSGADLYFFIHDMLEKREDLMPLVREFEEIDATIKKYFTGAPNFIIGRYSVCGKWVERDVVKVPPKELKKYTKKERVWQIEIATTGLKGDY